MKLNFHENHRLLFGVVFFGFIILSVIIAIAPAMWVQKRNEPIPGSQPLTPAQKRGLKVYVEESCMYCHTQQVRPLNVDKPFGRPSAPGDFARLRPLDFWRMTPALLGSERTGPDLSNIGNRQSSATWHYIHLYNPRAVVEASVMQAYPWLFKTTDNPGSDDIVVPIPKEYVPGEGNVIASQKAQDLVAYLLSLKQPAIPGLETQASVTGPGKKKGGPDQGPRIFNSNCASCHQRNGQGIPGTFPPLKDDPVVSDPDPTRHIEIVLFGLKGKTIKGVTDAAGMPAHKDMLSDEEIAAVINHEPSSWGNNAPLVTPEQVAKVRKKGKRTE